MEPTGRRCQVLPLDEPHGIERLTVGPPAQVVDRHDSRMLQIPRDLSLEHESLAADRILRMIRLDLLELATRR